jgi:drug/metabolite transporter (DMT)-like permease
MTSQTRPLAAALWMLGSIFSFVGMSIAGRALKPFLDVPEIMTWRSLIGLVIVVALARAVRLDRLARREKLKWHALRNTVHFAGQGLWFWALMSIPLAQLFALEFTSPIWVILLAPLVLGERLTRVKLLAAALGFAGVLVVARPDFGHWEPGVIAALVAAVCFAGNIMMTKRLTGTEPILTILFWQTAMQLVMGLALSAWDGAVTLPPVEALPALAVVGVGGIVAHFSLTKALSLAPATFVIPIDFVRLPMAAVLGLWLYGEALEWAVLVGAALIFLGNWINIRYGAR